MNDRIEPLVKSIDVATVKAITAIPPQTSVTLSSAGDHLIYCDNPEAFSVVPSSSIYLWGAGIGTSFKDVEMYHRFYNGWNNTAQIRTGLAVRNSNSSATTITYKCSTGYLDGGSDSTALSTTPGVLRSFINKSTSTVSVPAYGTVFLCGYTGNFVQNQSKFAFVRARLKSTRTSNVYVRTFVVGANNVSDMNSVFNISTPETGENAHFCGELPYNEKSVSLSATQNNSYRFFGSSTVNTNEYDTPYTTPKSPGLSYLDGNYGVKYTLNITNASGKTLNVVPDWTVSGRTAASLLYKLNSGSWTVGSVLSSGMMWSFSLGSNSTATFSFYLAGGNYGNYLVYFS